MFEKKTLNIYSVIIGIFFLISGAGKVVNTAAFSDLINQYGLGYTMVLSPLIVLAEILLGLFLVLLINPKRDSMVSFFLLIIFTISFAYAHFINGVNDCGCFGTIQKINLPPVFSFIRNFILIVMAFILWIKYPREISPVAGWRKYIILTVMGISIFIAGYTYEMPFGLTNGNKDHRFQNQNIKNTNLSEYAKTSLDSTYLFFCFSYTCPYCWNSIENLRSFTRNKAVDRVIVLATGELKDKLVFEQKFLPDFSIRNLPVTEMDKLTDAYPTAFYVEHDTVKVILKSELPSPFIFKSMFNLADPR